MKTMATSQIIAFLYDGKEDHQCKYHYTAEDTQQYIQDVLDWYGKGELYTIKELSK